MTIKQTIFNHIKNIGSWSTKRKLVLFSVDDYGNLRIRSQKALKALVVKGLEVHQRFDRLDNLENTEDLKLLFEVLQSVRDSNNRPAVFTPYALPCNINFEAMAENNFSQYLYEQLPETYAKLAREDSDYQGTWSLWQQGINKGIMAPQFHGREHFNLAIFKDLLVQKDENMRACLQAGSYVTVPAHANYSSGWTAAFAYQREKEIDQFPEIIKSGVRNFKEVYGYAPTVFTPPAQHFPPQLDNKVPAWGFKAMDRPFRQSRNYAGQTKKVTHKQGLQKNGMVQVVRNVVFEPTDPRGFDWVDYTFKQVEAAFRLGKPANISSHRVNFVGGMDHNNREIGLKALGQLLNRIVKAWPEVEFISVGDLVKEIKSTG